MEGGVSPDTFTANWLHVEGRGRGGSVSKRSQGRAALWGRGEGGGSVLIRGYL